LLDSLLQEKKCINRTVLMIDRITVIIERFLGQ